VLDSDGASAVVSAMHAWPNDKTLLDVASGTLLRMLHAGGDAAVDKLEHAEAREACTAALRLNDSAEVNESAQAVLALLYCVKHEGHAAARLRTAALFQADMRDVHNGLPTERLRLLCEQVGISSEGLSRSKLISASERVIPKLQTSPSVEQLLAKIHEETRLVRRRDCRPVETPPIDRVPQQRLAIGRLSLVRVMLRLQKTPHTRAGATHRSTSTRCADAPLRQRMRMA
jgi:hypothetical protein